MKSEGVIYVMGEGGEISMISEGDVGKPAELTEDGFKKEFMAMSEETRRKLEPYNVQVKKFDDKEDKFTREKVPVLTIIERAKEGLTKMLFGRISTKEEQESVSVLGGLFDHEKQMDLATGQLVDNDLNTILRDEVVKFSGNKNNERLIEWIKNVTKSKKEGKPFTPPTYREIAEIFNLNEEDVELLIKNMKRAVLAPAPVGVSGGGDTGDGGDGGGTGSAGTEEAGGDREEDEDEFHEKDDKDGNERLKRVLAILQRAGYNAGILTLLIALLYAGVVYAEAEIVEKATTGR